MRKLRKIKPHISFTDTSVIKVGPVKAINIEVSKAKAAGNIAISSNLFRTPKIISHNAKEGKYKQERIYGFQSLQFLAAYGRAYHPIWHQIGTVLAVIHEQLEPIDCPNINLPQMWLGSDNVWIHGDFNLVNVGYIKGTKSILILDWSTPDIINGIYSKGPSLFDVAWFLKSLFFLPSKMLFPYGLEKKATNFLNGYIEYTSTEIDNEQLTDLTLKSTALFKSHFAKSGVKQYFYSKREKRLKSFLKSRDIKQ